MPRAVLSIGVEGAADIARAFGQIRQSAKAANAGILSDEQKLNKERVKLAKETAQKQKEEERKAAREVQRAAREKARTEKTFQDERAKAHIRLEDAKTKATEKAEKDRTKAEEREHRKRVKNDAQFAREHDRIHSQMVSAREQRDRQAAQRAHQAAAQEVRDSRREEGRIWRYGWAAGHQAVSTTRSIMGDMTNERQRNAPAQRQLGQALYQAGAGSGDVSGSMRRMIAFAGEHGLDIDEMATAALASQTEFASFGTRRTGAADRNRAFDRFMQDFALGNSIGEDPTQVARLSAMLGTSGMDDRTRENMLLWAGGATQRGAVGVGQLTREGMEALRRRMASAVGNVAQTTNGYYAMSPDAQVAATTAAAQQAFVQTYAEMQVEQSAGIGPRRAGRALAQLGELIQGPRRQGMILTNIRNASGVSREQRQAIEQALFEGPSGHEHLRANAMKAPGFAALFAQAAGNNPALLMNILAGGGHGNAQGMQSNLRSVLGAMVARNVAGVAGYEEVNALMAQDTALTNNGPNSDVARGRGIFEHDPLAEQRKTDAQRRQQLTDNTSALVRLTASVDAWSGRNPITSEVVKGGLTLGTGIGGAMMGAKFGAARTAQIIAQQAGTATAAAGEAGGAAGTAGRAAGTAGRVGGMLGRAGRFLGSRAFGAATAFLDILTTNSNERGVNAGGALEEQQMARVRGITEARTGRGPASGASQAEMTAFAVEVVRLALERARITATIAPADANHVVQQQATGTNAASPVNRR